MEIWEAFKKAHYGKNVVVQSEWGTICFDPDSLSEVVDGDRITYEEYLEIQLQSAKNVRHYFERCYYSIPLGFRGQIERRTKNKVCFKRIYVEGMYSDGTCFSGKEDHVWMDLKDFEDCQVGDSVSFIAEIYRYLKTGNGKAIDFGLRNPKEIKRIPEYELPTDKELIEQDIDLIVCETCYLNECCTPSDCILRKLKKARTREWLNLTESHFE